MSIPKCSLNSIPTCYATVSIGTPATPLPSKLAAISAAGFQGIELGFPDLLSFASRYHGREIEPQNYDALCEAGNEVKALCRGYGLKIVMLQPFSNFEGWEEGLAEREDAFRRAKGWIRIMQAVGTDMLQVIILPFHFHPSCIQSSQARDPSPANITRFQVGSTDSPTASPSLPHLSSDLRALCDLLAPHSFRLAYENWCWATHAPDWKDVWAIVQAVDRPNIGLCLDTFQTAGGEWADPTTPSGLIENQKGGREELEQRFTGSLEALGKEVPADKIFILQISDAYKPSRPLDPEPDGEGMRARGRWSSCLRPLPFAGGYLPVVDVARAVLRTGFRGWFSMEVFDGGPEGGDKEWRDMGGYARKAMRAHERLVGECADA
ncbi:MAG: hypothetical protein L6R37_006655 [Teloschistes peruensis]|nr:MAG: hypothetical protein L6R37_006655 [Teloschistes peruensis]